MVVGIVFTNANYKTVGRSSIQKLFGVRSTAAVMVKLQDIAFNLIPKLDQFFLCFFFRITAEEEAAILEMDYQDMTIYWAYGDREDIPAMGLPSSVYVDRQGTDEVFSRLSIAQSDRGYVVEMEIYRLGYFSGTAVESDGMLVYTDDLTDMMGTIRYDSDHAVFEVTQSTSGLAQVGTTWVFPEAKEEF